MTARRTASITLAIAAILLLSSCATAEPEPTSTATQAPVEATLQPLNPDEKNRELGEPTLTIATFKTMKWSPIMRPDDHGENYWQIVDPERGYPADGGTDFLMAHACEGSQVCIGDQLRELQLGDVVAHKERKFEVVDKFIISKSELVNSGIWFHDANRIVIITCVIEGNWQDSDKNEVLIAVQP